jgi:hypothetical protein
MNERVGVTSTEKTFNVAFAFISNEKKNNFTWILQECQRLLRSKVTPRCKWDCKTKDGEDVKHSDVVKSMMSSFEDVLDSPTKEHYAKAVVEFRKLCKR